MRRKLDYQADRLEVVLSAHRVAGRILDGTVTPRLMRFHLLPTVVHHQARVIWATARIAPGATSRIERKP